VWNRRRDSAIGRIASIYALNASKSEMQEEEAEEMRENSRIRRRNQKLFWIRGMCSRKCVTIMFVFDPIFVNERLTINTNVKDKAIYN
jgi:hypothetical protein